MLDPQLIRNELDNVASMLKKRGMNLDTNTIQELEDKRKVIQIRTEELQSLRNSNQKRSEKLKVRVVMQAR